MGVTVEFCACRCEQCLSDEEHCDGPDCAGEFLTPERTKKLFRGLEIAIRDSRKADASGELMEYYYMVLDAIANDQCTDPVACAKATLDSYPFQSQ